MSSGDCESSLECKGFMKSLSIQRCRITLQRFLRGILIHRVHIKENIETPVIKIHQFSLLSFYAVILQMSSAAIEKNFDSNTKLKYAIRVQEVVASRLTIGSCYSLAKMRGNERVGKRFH